VIKGDKYSMTERKLCARCEQKYRAINYKKADRIYYRSMCESCIVQSSKRSKTEWLRVGYKKKLTCEACNFIPKVSDQLIVYKYKTVFKTICLNCEIEAKVSEGIFVNKVKPDF